ATGYGYIQIANEIPADPGAKAYTVKTFAEKPNQETAGRFLSSGDFLWNSGIFIIPSEVYLDAVKQFLPDLYAGLMEIRRAMHKPYFNEVLNRVYRQIKGVSIDYGLMEKAGNVYTVRGEFSWNDLGSWEQVYDISKKDAEGNAVSGEALFVDTRDSYVYSQEGLVAMVGLENVIVVRDGDAILVCARDRAEDVKKVTEWLRAKKMTSYL
ncbi:MAG TPA: mannose-1-phosphate guanylyltransferase, partial [bacterium]|nr:mannose-1-phosphate guanylyltransferase [bacterium]